MTGQKNQIPAVKKPQIREKSRLLTLAQLRKAGACSEGRNKFRKIWGKQVLVNQQWARQAAQHFCTVDAFWCCWTLLPLSWARDVVVPLQNKYSDAPRDTWVHINWAVFAACYVKAE